MNIAVCFNSLLGCIQLSWGVETSECNLSLGCLSYYISAEITQGIGTTRGLIFSVHGSLLAVMTGLERVRQYGFANTLCSTYIKLTT